MLLTHVWSSAWRTYDIRCLHTGRNHAIVTSELRSRAKRLLRICQMETKPKKIRTDQKWGCLGSTASMSLQSELLAVIRELQLLTFWPPAILLQQEVGMRWLHWQNACSPRVEIPLTKMPPCKLKGLSFALSDHTKTRHGISTPEKFDRKISRACLSSQSVMSEFSERHCLKIKVEKEIKTLSMGL